MKKHFKLIALSAVVTLTVSSFASCKSTGGNKSGIVREDLDPEKIGYYSSLELPIDDKNTTITIICDTSVTNQKDNVIIKELSRRTGLDVQPIEIPRATIKEKAKVLLASKDQMPDIFSGGFTFDEVNDFGMQGAFEPIEKHLDELPNLKEIFYTKAEEHKTVDKIKGFKAYNGELYIFPQYDVNRDVNHGMLYRKDIFDKHNIPMWNSTEEFYQTLKQLKQLYPDSNPMVSKTMSTIFNQLGGSWGINLFNPYFDEDSKTWKHSATDEKFKDLLDFLKKLYNEGLIDPEFLTATQAAWTSKMTQKDKAFVTFDWIGRLDTFKEQTLQTVPEYDLRYANPIGPTGKVVSLSNVGGGPAVKKGDNSLLALKLLDYLISDSGAKLLTLGIEGVTYEMGEDGFAKYYGFDEGKAVGINELEEKYGLFTSGLYRRFDRKSTYFKYSEREKEAQDLMLNKKGGGFLPEDPALVFTPEEKETTSKYVTPLSKAAEEFATKYILSSETGDTAWNTWLAKAKTLGVDEILNVYNQAQVRFDKMD